MILTPIVAASRGKRRTKNLRAVRPNRQDELAYKTQLLAIVRAIQKAVEVNVVKSGVAQAYTADSAATDAMDAVRRAVRNLVGVADTMAKSQATRVQGTVDKSLATAVKNRLGIDIASALVKSVALQAAFAEAVAANADLIRSLSSTYISRVQELVENNLQQGLRHESLVKEIRRIGKVTESRAKLIARDQTSKMNSSFNQVRQQQIGIEKYTWSTSGDERVRPEHASQDGQVFRWDTPPASTGHPGHDVQCRCVAIPIIE